MWAGFGQEESGNCYPIVIGVCKTPHLFEKQRVVGTLLAVTESAMRLPAHNNL
jgi:hypothetical protein